MINLSVPEADFEMRPRITVFGVGGAGNNAVNNMIRSELEGVEFVVANTDAQALKGSLSTKRIQLGTTITRGLGAGSRPDVGRAAAEEQIEEILEHLEGANMCFITAGMGGGTGTGAAPVIARVAREKGILTVGVVTKPFHFEGAHRMRLAESGIGELQQYVDTLIIIPNQNLFRVANEKTTFADAFKMADDVLHAGVSGVTDLMVKPGLINLDFADIRSVMTEMGKAMMGTGEATGERRAIDAAEAAISNPLLDDVSMKGAKGVLINITGGMDMTLFEVDEAANRVRDEVDPDANIIFGSTFDPSLDGRMRVSVVATGIDTLPIAQTRPVAAPALAVVGGRTASAPALRPAAAPARAEAVRSGPDYHHTLAPAPMAPAPVASAAATARKLEHAPEPVVQPAQVEPAATPAPAQPAQAAVAEPVPAQPAAQRGETFIPPQPVEAPRAPVAAPERFTPPAADPAPKKRGGLFGIVTGLSRRIVEGSDPVETATPAAPAQAAPAAPTLSAPTLSAPAQAPQRPAAPAQQPQQPTLAVAPADRPVTAHDQDMLDIPAFLRRQAN
ncbi:cell division protein FtsZ [Arenibaculum pallidiluteum]|uniref:cell division protein FtsZ n=1 Tax=Arenibaculum pallidiluteum TaxID=2812559 RepID=UPI001A97D007|nr:cell division protein FtsZ [Arenibaculum pallidiluteum]